MTREGLQFEVRSADRLDSAGCFMVHEAHFPCLLRTLLLNLQPYESLREAFRNE
jgi:hypothetical protein